MLYDLLKNTAVKFPNNIAAEDKAGSITYSDMLKYSNILGEKIAAEFGNSKFIGILMDKSVDYIISIFGILYNHMAYVPLDEGLPPARIKYIIDNVGLKYMIADPAHYNTACRLCDPANIILFDQKKLSESHQTDYNSRENGSENDIAYILYTSGSTGYPKGIIHTQKSALAFIDWAIDYFKVNETDVFSSHAPFHFDLSIFDIYVCISVGAKLCILLKSISSFPLTLINYIKSKKISVWYSVPYILVNMFSNNNINGDSFGCLRTIIYAGESMSLQNAMKIREKLPNADIYNLYGPTETNVITYYKIDESTFSHKDRQIPIGVACPYTNIRVINETGIEVKDGEPGELMVKSDSLMMGYVGGKPIDQKNFEYATGDIVKKESDVFVFTGRKDHMVKVNGFRVELGDIENNVKDYPDIIDCYAKVKKIGDKDTIEVEIESKANINIQNLSRHISSKLPGYMIPDSYIIKPELERNSRGKLIRKWDRH